MNKLIAIESIGARINSSYTTELQANLLNEGIPTKVFTFPNYNCESGKQLDKFLSGLFGNPLEADPKLATFFYAMNRNEFKYALKDSLQSNGEPGLVICDGYVGRNLAFQGAKLSDDKREDFINWANNYEYKIIGMPVPDKTICLINPEVETVRNEVRKNHYYKLSNDYLNKVDETYNYLLKTQPNWVVLDCSFNGKKKSMTQVARSIVDVLENEFGNIKLK